MLALYEFSLSPPPTHGGALPDGDSAPFPVFSSRNTESADGAAPCPSAALWLTKASAISAGIAARHHSSHVVSLLFRRRWRARKRVSELMYNMFTRSRRRAGPARHTRERATHTNTGASTGRRRTWIAEECVGVAERALDIRAIVIRRRAFVAEADLLSVGRIDHDVSVEMRSAVIAVEQSLRGGLVFSTPSSVEAD